MIFYRINATPAFLAGTQADARREAKAAGAKWEQVDVPTDKAGLLAFVNDLFKQAAPQMPLGAPQEPAERSEPAPGSMSQGQVDALFAPAPAREARRDGWGDNPIHSAAAIDRRAGLPADEGERVDAICDAIEELRGHHLGNVCCAVAHRFRLLEQRAKAMPDELATDAA